MSNISLPLLGIVDTAILGHLENTRYLGAVAIGASILSFLYWGFGFLRMGTTGLVARAAGAGDDARELLAVAHSLILALALALAVFALHPLWLSLGVALMAPGPELEPLTRSYVSIRIFSAPAVLVTYAIVGWFIGRQDTRWPMAFVVVTNLLNIVLDVLFVVILDMKSDGAALATLCAEYVGCALAVMAILHRLDWRPLAGMKQQLLALAAYRQLLVTSHYLFIRTICLLFGFAFFTAMSTRLGETILAANTIMLQLLMLAAYGLDGFAFAAEGLAGNAAGAGDMGRFNRAVRACWHWSVATAGTLGLLFLIAGPWLYPLFTPHQPVLQAIATYHGWLVLMPLVAAPSYLLDGVFIGAARTRYMMHSMLIALLLVYLPCWFVLQHYENHGLWLSFLAFNAARGLSLAWYFRQLTEQGRWLDAKYPD